MAEEIFDIYDGCNRPLGVQKPRSEVHRDGLWHRTFHCWIVYKGESGEPFVVLQKRSSKKKTWPGRFDISAAGHYAVGETGPRAGLRELEEELGIQVPPEKLRYVGTRVCVEEAERGVKNHEFQEVFFLKDGRPLKEYKQSADELDAIVAVPIRAAVDLLAGRTAHLKAAGVTPAGAREEFLIKRDDFIPHIDEYNYKALILARRFLDGEVDLQI